MDNKLVIKYVNICEGWAIKIHPAKSAVYRKDAELTLCKKCYNDWKKDDKLKNKIKKFSI